MLLISFILLTSLTLRCYSALTFETCGTDGVLEIPESQLNGNNLYTEFSCRSTLLPGSEYFINLIFHDKDANTSTPIAWCGATLRGFYSSTCSSSSMTLQGGATFTPGTFNTTGCRYKLEFPQNNEPAVVGNTLKCRHATEQVQCTIDVVSQAQETQCNLTYDTDTLPWTLSARCVINDTYSGMGRYYCQLFARNMNVMNSSYEAVDSRVSIKNTSLAGQKLVSGSCLMNATLPSRDGFYSYSVQITPGDITVPINDTALIEIQRPSPSKLTHSCPSSISERDKLDCTCSYSGTSKPPSTVQWSGESSGHLQRGPVERDQNGHNFTCQLMWNENVFDQLTYTLNMSWSPDSNNTNNTCPACVTEAASSDGSSGLTSTHVLAIGIGGGLSVTAICVTIIVVVVVCRKRRGVPQNRLRSEQTDESGPCPRLQALSRPSNAPPGIEDLQRVEQGAARVGYDALRKEENVDGQNYELMGVPTVANPKLSQSAQQSSRVPDNSNIYSNMNENPMYGNI